MPIKLYVEHGMNFWKHYLTQTGTGIVGYKGNVYQRGTGLGSFFKGLFRMALPLLTNVCRAVGQEALSSGAQVLVM